MLTTCRLRRRMHGTTGLRFELHVNSPLVHICASVIYSTFLLLYRDQGIEKIDDDRRTLFSLSLWIELLQEQFVDQKCRVKCNLIT
jgi:hypothetical protein